MTTPLSNDALNVLFHQARTHSAWLDKPVSDHLLHQLYEVMKNGPTRAHCLSADAGSQAEAAARLESDECG
jgi:3-hydroxypropanoate dehydrogenase